MKLSKEQFAIYYHHWATFIGYSGFSEATNSQKISAFKLFLKSIPFDLNTHTMTKEELRKKFDKFMNSAETLTPSRSRIFDFFYAEIVAKENANTILEGALKYQRERNDRLESLVVAAEELISYMEEDTQYHVSYQMAREKYNHLKNLKG